VRDEHGGDLDVVEDGLELARGAGAGAGVQRRERLVEQEDAGLERQGAGHAHALALASRERAGPPVGRVADPEALQQLLGPFAALAPGQAAHRVGHVLPGAQVPEQGVVLEHVAAAPALRGDVDALGGVQPGLLLADDAAALGTGQPGDDAQHSGLAGAGRAGERQARRPGRGEGDLELERAQPGARVNVQHRRGPARPWRA
jgi:hypothetical protein